MQTDTGTIHAGDQAGARRAPRAVLALVAAALVTAIAVAVPASRDDTPARPAIQPITVDTTLPAIGFSHVPPHAPLSPPHVHGPRQAPKLGTLGGYPERDTPPPIWGSSRRRYVDGGPRSSRSASTFSTAAFTSSNTS